MSDELREVAKAAYAVVCGLTTSTDPEFASYGYPRESRAQELRAEADRVEAHEAAISRLRRALYKADPEAFEQMRFFLRSEAKS